MRGVISPTGGITDEVKLGFIAAMLSHKRPISELLSPNFQNQEHIFIKRFQGMSLKSFSYDDLKDTFKRLVKELHCSFSEQDKKFLISFKTGNPNWDLNPIKKLKELPAIQWKLDNPRKLIKNNPSKHSMLLAKLERALSN